MFNKVCLVMALLYSNFSKCEENKVHHITLDTSGDISLHWLVDESSNAVEFEVHISLLEFGWFGIGFSNYGETHPADYCLLLNDFQKYSLIDTWADESGFLHLDQQQDCKRFEIKNLNNVTKFAFRRDIDTCDSKDYIIEEGTTHILWIRGSGPVFHVNELDLNLIQSNNKGMTRATLLKNNDVIQTLPNHVRQLNFMTNKVQLSASETTYWCEVFKLPDSQKQKHHIYKYEANIQHNSLGVVHHMELFHCEASVHEIIPTYKGPCFDKNRPAATQVCKKVIAAWAMGASPFIFPEEAGLPIGGQNFNPYVMLEIHYNNEEEKFGIVDSSGITLYVSSKLREMDAAIMELGLEYTDKMAIPPGQELFSLTGYCVYECTAVGFPATGITIFGSQLHTHLTGVRVLTKHIRNGVELPELNRDNHYSTHFQEIRRLKRPVRVLPGDALLTQCDFDTTNRKNITVGGFAISDEMCVNYVHYFPSTELEVCKSSISDQALNTYFRYMNEWEGQKTTELNGISQNYNNIEWNKMRVQLLRKVYNEAPLSMQCNMSSGERFPGYWENTPLTQISVPLPPKQRHCEQLTNK